MIHFFYFLRNVLELTPLKNRAVLLFSILLDYKSINLPDVAFTSNSTKWNLKLSQGKQELLENQ